MSIARVYMRICDVIGLPLLGFVAIGGLHFVSIGSTFFREDDHYARSVQSAPRHSRAVETQSPTDQPADAHAARMASPPPREDEPWVKSYNRALDLKLAGRMEQARPAFEEVIEVLKRDHSADHPAIARIHYDLALIEEKEGRKDRMVEHFERAHEQLTALEDASVQEALSGLRTRVHLEMVASKLGAHYWHQRNYAESYRWYRAGYDAIPRLKLSDYSRNLKLAQNASGIMATSCMLGREEESRRAMKELKRRHRDLEPGAQKPLNYWIKSGDRFLNGGRCRK